MKRSQSSEIPNFVRDKVGQVMKELTVKQLNKVMRIAGELSWNEWNIDEVVDKLHPEFDKTYKKGLATKNRLKDIAISLTKELKDLNYNFPAREKISPLDMWFYGSESFHQDGSSRTPLRSARRIKTSQIQGSASPPSSSSDADDSGSNATSINYSCEEVGKEIVYGPKRTTPIGLFEDECAFCHSFRTPKLYGPIMCCVNGRLAEPDEVENEENLVYVHQKCLDWAPCVYYSGDLVMNLEKEIERGSHLTCSKCGVRGAVLGCFYGSCRKTFHVTCALELPDCRWDAVNYTVLCPIHASMKLKCDDSSIMNSMDSSPENSQVNESTKIETETREPVSEEHYELNHDLDERIKVNQKTSNIFAGLRFFLSCYLSPSTKESLEEQVIAYGGTIMNETDLCSLNSNSNKKSVTKYLVYNEDPPKDMSLENLETIRVERTREVLDFSKKTGSSRIISYKKISVSISSLKKGILDENLL